ncbi:hypothetical protein BD560DRAFT_31623 [Blakeslea trispora]|nr:hypothetical protein BD560DRAFT_31623 [Blakeslea trispora]
MLTEPRSESLHSSDTTSPYSSSEDPFEKTERVRGEKNPCDTVFSLGNTKIAPVCLVPKTDDELRAIAFKPKKFDPSNPYLFGQRPPKPPSEESMKRHRPHAFDETVRKCFSGNTKRQKIFEDYLPQHNGQSNTLALPPTHVKRPLQLAAKSDHDFMDTQPEIEKPIDSFPDTDTNLDSSIQEEEMFASTDRIEHTNDIALPAESNTDQINSVDRPKRETSKNKVRIFGFHPDEANQVVQFFSSLGEMVELPHCEPNLIVLHYQSPEAAAKAVECNGTMFGQDHIIGVTYNDPSRDIKLKVHDTGSDIYNSNQHHNPTEQESYSQQNNGFFRKLKSIIFGN